MLAKTVVAGLVLTAALGVLAGAAISDYRSPIKRWRGRRSVYLTAYAVSALALGSLALLVR